MCRSYWTAFVLSLVFVGCDDGERAPLLGDFIPETDQEDVSDVTDDSDLEANSDTTGDDPADTDPVDEGAPANDEEQDGDVTAVDGGAVQQPPSAPSMSSDPPPTDMSECGPCRDGTVCCPSGQPCAGQCVPDCRIDQMCPASDLSCDSDTGVCTPMGSAGPTSMSTDVPPDAEPPPMPSSDTTMPGGDTMMPPSGGMGGTTGQATEPEPEPPGPEAGDGSAEFAVPGNTSGVAMRGTTLVVGHPGTPGFATVYDWVDGLWVEGQQLDPGELQANSTQMFGSDLAYDGERLAIAAYASGSVFIFEPNADTGLLEQTSAISEGTSSRFGTSLAWYGETLFVGAPMERVNQDGTTKNFSGAIYAVTRDRARWSSAEIARSNFAAAEVYEYMGHDIAITGDMLVAGAPGVAGKAEYIGKVFVFDISGVTLDEVTQVRPADAVYEDSFGSSVAALDDLIVVGAQGRSEDRGGYALVYRRVGSELELLQRLDPPEGQEIYFGAEAMFIDGSQLFVGGAHSVVEFTGEPGSYVAGRVFSGCSGESGASMTTSNQFLVAGGDYELGFNKAHLFDLTDPDTSCVE